MRGKDIWRGVVEGKGSKGGMGEVDDGDRVSGVGGGVG